MMESARPGDGGEMGKVRAAGLFDAEVTPDVVHGCPRPEGLIRRLFPVVSGDDEEGLISGGLENTPELGVQGGRGRPVALLASRPARQGRNDLTGEVKLPEMEQDEPGGLVSALS
jgi:hypothetical protein